MLSCWFEMFRYPINIYNKLKSLLQTKMLISGYECLVQPSYTLEQGKGSYVLFYGSYIKSVDGEKMSSDQIESQVTSYWCNIILNFTII